MSTPESTAEDASPSDQAPISPAAGTLPASMREVARRVFAVEFNDATHTFQEADEDRAPRYALLPTGAAANRMFIVGTLTEATDVGSDTEYWQARIVDPTGTVFAYAGQYQPDAAALLRTVEPPTYVAVVGKPRTYDTEDGETLSSIRSESITVVDEATRDRWLVETAERTIARLEAFDEPDNDYTALAREEYELHHAGYVEAIKSVLSDLEAADSVADSE